MLKWQTRWRDKFGLEFRIVDADLVRRAAPRTRPGRQPVEHYPRLIVVDRLAEAAAGDALLREVLPPTHSYPRAFDMLVVDEVHNVRPVRPGQVRDRLAAHAGDPRRSRRTSSTACSCRRPRTTATASRGRRCWSCSTRSASPAVSSPTERSLRRVMVRRLKSELRDDPPANPDGTPRFAEREIIELEVAYPDENARRTQLLRRYTSRAWQPPAARPRASAADFVTLLLKKRLFSSPAAFAQTLETHIATLRHARPSAPRNRRRRCQAAFDADRLRTSPTTTPYSEAAEEAARRRGRRRRRRHATSSDAARARCRRGPSERQHRPDAKAQRAARLPGRHLRRPGRRGQWNDERVIVFTEYRDTQLWLYDLLADRVAGASSTDRVALLYGGMDDDDREHIKAEFQAHPTRRPVAHPARHRRRAARASTCNCTATGSCTVEIPFNPNRLEQRNGRVDRHGQPSPGGAHPPLRRRRLAEAPRAGSLEDDLEFLDPPRPQARPDPRGPRQRRSASSPTGRTADARRARHPRRAAGCRSARPRPACSSVERDLREEVARLARRLDDTRTSSASPPHAIERVVRTGLRLARQAPPRSRHPRPTRRRPPPVWPGVPRRPAHRELGSRPCSTCPTRSNRTRSARSPSTTRSPPTAPTTSSLPTSATRSSPRRMRLLRGRDLVDRSASRTSHRVTARIVADADLSELVVAIHARLVITGRGGHRLHEEVIAAGGRIAGGPLLPRGLPRRRTRPRPGRRHRRNAAHPTSARRSPTLGPPSRSRCAAPSRTAPATAPSQLDPVAAAARRRRRRRAANRPQRAAHIDPLRARTPLRTRTADARLRPGRTRQFTRDIDALGPADAIPAEMDDEEVAIRRRYEDQALRLFPAAVTFLVPRRMVTAGVAEALTRRSPR